MTSVNNGLGLHTIKLIYRCQWGHPSELWLKSSLTTHDDFKILLPKIASLKDCCYVQMYCRNLILCSPLCRLQLKSVETVYPQRVTTVELRVIHSQHRNDPWKKQVKKKKKKSAQTGTLHLFVHIVRLTFAFGFRWTWRQEGSITEWKRFYIVYVE